MFAEVSGLERHLQKIEDVILKQKKNYIEVGWPVYGCLPNILNYFRSKGIEVKIVHLARNPFDTALSFFNGKWYQPRTEVDHRAPLYKKYIEVHELNPLEDEVFSKDYAERYDAVYDKYSHSIVKDGIPLANSKSAFSYGLKFTNIRLR